MIYGYGKHEGKKLPKFDEYQQDLYNICMATKTLNIALDERLVKKIDQAVKQSLGSRSEYFRRLALADLERRSRWAELFRAGQSVGREMGITSEQQVYDILDG